MAASLLELPRDCLIRIVAQLPFAERLQLNRVCRRLRQLCREPSEVWATVEARPTFNPDATTEAVSHWMFALRRWLRLRGGGVEELSVDCRRSDGGRLPHQWALPGSLLPGPVDGVAALPLLRRLIIRFPGRALLSFSSLPALPALNTLWIAHAAITVDSQPPACPSIPPGLDVSLFHGLVGGLMDGPWLPTQTTRLKLLDMQRTALPGCVAHLPRLHSLDWNANGTLAMASLARLTQTAALAQTLQQLDLGENSLNRFPHEVSVLTNLRVLFLYQNFSETPLAPNDWNALQPLRRLRFLSISSNGLAELPAAVGGMTQLRGLHLEGNPWRVQLPPAPCFGRLLELLLDWKDALRSPGVLRCATALTRLVLTDHSAVVLSPPAGRLVLGAETADALLDALASLPRLQRLEDVVNPRAIISHRPDVLTPAPARVMWEAGRRCPALHLDVIPSTYIGWSLETLPAEVAAEDAAAAAAAAGGEAAAA